MSHIETRIRESLAKRQGTIREISERVFASPRAVETHIKRMHQAGEIHIATWRRGTSGPIAPVYRKGKGVDTERFKPTSPADRCKRYRAKLRAEYGENYKHIHAAMKKHIPGRRVIVAGEVIYESPSR